VSTLASCGALSGGEKLVWGAILFAVTALYLAGIVVPVLLAKRGERRYLAGCGLAAFAIGAALLLAPGGIDDAFGTRLFFAAAIGAGIGLGVFGVRRAGMGIRRARLVSYLVVPTLSGASFAAGFVVLLLGLLVFTDACLD
jgi:hypothetical protein